MAAHIALHWPRLSDTGDDNVLGVSGFHNRQYEKKRTFVNWFLKRSLSLRIMVALGATFFITSALNVFWIGELQKEQAHEAAQELAAKITDTTPCRG